MRMSRFLAAAVLSWLLVACTLEIPVPDVSTPAAETTTLAAANDWWREMDWAAANLAAPSAPTPSPTDLLRDALRPRAGVALHIVNQADRDLCYLFISPVSDSEWGVDRLGPDETIPPGGQTTIRLEPDQYDLLALDCQENTLAEAREMTVDEETVWPVGETPTGDDTDGDVGGDTTARDDEIPPPAALPTPVALGETLCCGSAPGESGLIWSVPYPAGWTVTRLPDNPEQFFGAMFADPAGNVLITLIPGSNTEPNHPLDVGDVDRWLDTFLRLRQNETADFVEVLREPVPGVPNGRLWLGTWGQGSDRAWEGYLVVVDPVPAVAPGLPKAYLSLFGLRAFSAHWNNGYAAYQAMMDGMLVRRFGGEPEGLPLREPSQKPFMVRWCATTCDWMAVDADSPDWVGDCGEPTTLWETPCKGAHQDD